MHFRFLLIYLFTYRFIELETAVHNWASRIRVVQHLSGGANLLFPGAGGGATVAVRVYTTKDIMRLDKEQSKIDPYYSGNIPQNYELEDLDGLCSFRDAFMYPVVIFILPPGQAQQDQLSRPNSFTMKAQTVLKSSRIARSLKVRNNTSGGGQEKKVSFRIKVMLFRVDEINSYSQCFAKRKMRLLVFITKPRRQRRNSARFFIVPDTITVLRTLSTVLESIRPERIERQRKYFLAEAKKSGLPDAETGEVISEAALVKQTIAAFRKWARRYEIPEGDEGVLLSVLGSISNIASASADTLSATPIDDLTRDVVLAFFGKEQPPVQEVKYDFQHSYSSSGMVNLMANDAASHSLSLGDNIPARQAEQNTLFEQSSSQGGDRNDIYHSGEANEIGDHYESCQYQHEIQFQNSCDNPDSFHHNPNTQNFETGMYEENVTFSAPARQSGLSGNGQHVNRDFFTPVQPFRDHNVSRGINDSSSLQHHHHQRRQSAPSMQNNNHYLAEHNHQQQYGSTGNDQTMHGTQQHQYHARQYNARHRNRLVDNQAFSPFAEQQGYF